MTTIQTTHDLWPGIALAIGVIITVLILAVQHWFPTLRELSRVRCYIYGTAALWFGFTVWRLLLGDVWSPIGLALIDAFGGLSVITAYRIDDNVTAQRQARAAERNDATLELA